METFLITIVSVLFTTFLGAIGYFLKMIFDDTRNIARDVSEMKPRVEILWKDKLAPAQSPRQLNERGESMLNESGIKDVVDQKKDKLLQLVRESGATNAYDTEKAIEKVMNDLPVHFPDIVDKLKEGAFRAGVDISAILFVGSVYLRNQIFSDLGFSLTDLDNPKNPQSLP